VQLSIINNGDYDIQDEGSATNTDKPVFSSSNVLLKFCGFVILVAGATLGIFSILFSVEWLGSLGVEEQAALGDRGWCFCGCLDLAWRKLLTRNRLRSARL